jgi:hypothetical protein
LKSNSPDPPAAVQRNGRRKDEKHTPGVRSKVKQQRKADMDLRQLCIHPTAREALGGLQSKYKNMMDDAARQAAMEIAAAVVASAEELGHGDLEDSDEEDEEESELRHIDDEEDDDDAMEQLEFDDEDED